MGKGKWKGKVHDDGAIFKSPKEGNTYELTPESSIDIQMKIGIILISGGFAGAERVVKELLINSNKNDYVLFVNNEIHQLYKNLGVKTYNLGNVFNKNLLRKLIKLKKIAKKVKTTNLL